MAGPPIRASAAPRPVPSVWASACDATVIVCMALPLTVPVSSAFLCRSPGVVIPAAVVPPTVPWWTHAPVSLCCCWAPVSSVWSVPGMV